MIYHVRGILSLVSFIALTVTLCMKSYYSKYDLIATKGYLNIFKVQFQERSYLSMVKRDIQTGRETDKLSDTESQSE